MENTKTIDIQAEITPNPNSLKFNVSQTFLDLGSIDFTDKEKAKDSPLALKLLELEGIKGVLVGTTFVTVSKQNEIGWDKVSESIVSIIRDLLMASDGPYIDHSLAATAVSTSDTAIEKRIKEILDAEIRPAVAQDGGDINFQKYEDGVLTLFLQGACSSCPASTMTLKMGIENRLKQEIPEIKEVVQTS